jgi:hypothetical protein
MLVPVQVLCSLLSPVCLFSRSFLVNAVDLLLEIVTSPVELPIRIN